MTLAGFKGPDKQTRFTVLFKDMPKSVWEACRGAIRVLPRPAAPLMMRGLTGTTMIMQYERITGVSCFY